MRRHFDGYRAGVGAVALMVLTAVAITLAPPSAGAQSSGMSRSDFEAARDSFFSSADRNGDFALSGTELMSAMGATDAPIFDCDDADGDGLCSYSEYLDSGEKLFDELDQDSDGTLSSQELQ